MRHICLKLIPVLVAALLASLTLSCRGATTYYVDADGDGYGSADNAVRWFWAMPGLVDTAGDCNDGDASVNPDATEVPGNGVDDDCNPGTSDGSAPPPVDICEQCEADGGFCDGPKDDRVCYLF